MTGYTEEELIRIRRQLHQIPEIGLEEFGTQQLLLDLIQHLATDYMEVRKWQTGILVLVHGSQPEKTIGWRTDIDALPVTEEVESDYASQRPGFMHACGHDFHMTIALGLLNKFSYAQPKNNYLFLFQPAEENEAGGKRMYEAGVFKGEWRPDEFYGLHVRPDLPVGTIGTRAGTLFAGTCEIHAHLIGKSGHAAFPHEANDMVVAGSQLVQQAQTIISRNVDPIQGGVVTFGVFQAGSANNVIAGDAWLHGTIRALSQEVNHLTQQRMREIVKGIETSFQCQIDLDLNQKGYLPVVNDKERTRAFIGFMKQQPDVDLRIVEPAMTGEDFGYLLSKIPGTMFWLGVDSPYALHHSKFQPKEGALKFGVDAISRFLKSLDK